MTTINTFPSDFSRKRWPALLAALITGLLAGIIYSWSVYVNPLMDKYGWGIAETSMAYTINIIAEVLVPLSAARLRSKLSLQSYCLIGTLLYGGGLILCGFIHSSVWELYLYFGLLVGGGIGFIYLSVGPYVVRLFPDRRGLAAGLFTACYGLGGFLWAPTARAVISSTGDVSWAFITLGLGFIFLLTITTRFLFEIPMKKADEGGSATAADQAEGLAGSNNKSPAELLRSPLYYLVLAMFTCGLISGAMIMSLGGPILEDLLKYSPGKAALVVGFFSVASTSGRLLWGLASDKIGRFGVILFLGGATCLSMAVLLAASTEFIFICCLLLIPMCYGGYASTMAPMAMEAFGEKHFAVNYNLIFTAFGLSALIGPQIMAQAMASPDGYKTTFIFGFIFAGSSIALGLIFKQALARRGARQ